MSTWLQYFIYSRSRKVGSYFKQEKFEKQNCACVAQIDDAYSLYHSANHIVVAWLCQPDNKATTYNDFWQIDLSLTGWRCCHICYVAAETGNKNEVSLGKMKYQVWHHPQDSIHGGNSYRLTSLLVTTTTTNLPITLYQNNGNQYRNNYGSDILIHISNSKMSGKLIVSKHCNSSIHKIVSFMYLSKHALRVYFNL